MSIVLNYYPKSASKRELIDFFRNEKFQSCDYYLSPFPKGSTYLHWFDFQNYRSNDGLEVVIYPDKQGSPRGWSVYSRTRVWASAFDKEKQNEVIRKLRKQFGGHFYNDAEGRNRYIKLSPDEFLTSSESGVLQVYDQVKLQIANLSYALNDHKETFSIENTDSVHKDMVNLMKANAPSVVLYNSLIPFLISTIEHFFREVFVVLVEFDDYGKEQLKKVNLKEARDINTVEDVLKLINQFTKIEREVARGLNFQNLSRIKDSYQKFLKIDVLKILTVEKNINKRKVSLYHELEKLIERRHDVIHRFGLVEYIDKESYIYFLNLTSSVLDTFIEQLEKQKNMRLTENSVYYKV